VKKIIITTVIAMALYRTFSGATFSQEYNGIACEALKNATLPNLVRYLNVISINDNNADCVTLAIRRLGKERYEPAITTLVKFLDFRRPPTVDEKKGIYERPRITEELFPAAEALEEMGKPALPEILRAIEATSTSTRALDNAVSVWMEANKYDRPSGVALLKQEETKFKDDTIKQNIRQAVRKALIFCGEPDQAACQAAAAIS
jgi:hypothetical protein